MLSTNIRIASPGPQLAVESQHADTGPDLQNPQSLPSPPPEGHGTPDTQTTRHPLNSPDDDAGGTHEQATTTKEHTSKDALPELHRLRPPPCPSAGHAEKKKKVRKGPQVALRGPADFGRAAKRLKYQGQRAKKQQKHAAHQPGPDADCRARSADDDDDDDELWAAAEEDIPDELLNEEAWHQPVPSESRPVDQVPAAPATEVEPPPQHNEPVPSQGTVSRVVKEELEDPVASLRTACSTPFVRGTDTRVSLADLISAAGEVHASN